MKTDKCLYFRVLVLILIVPVSKTIPASYDTDDPIDQLITDQLLKDFENPRAFTRGTFTEPPQYMLDLYNEVADSGGVSISPLPHDASLVRALPVQVYDEERFTFSLENIPVEESVLEGEVHIHHHQLNNEQRKFLGNQILFNLNLFIKDDKGETLLLETQTVGSHFSGWRVFSVGSAVREARWKSGRITFLVESNTMDGEAIDCKFHHGHHSSTNPILVLFGATENSDDPFSFQELSSRNTFNDNSKSRRVTRSLKSIPENPLKIKKQSGCSLQHLPVNFEEIGWSWMVFPKEYDAFHCVGSCSFPLGQDYNPTNHATVVSVVHYLADESKQVSYPSCVPTAYQSLSILYFDVEETVVLKQFDGMVATECGCR